jgi:Asp-tRNA(Asn)/Glu-tRNA(Gln) amidotransferase A subunit family amidase
MTPAHSILRTLAGCILWTGLAAAPLSAARFDLSTATIADINAAFDAGALDAEKLTRLYLARIEAYDKQGPRINSVITLNPAALETARALDAERREKGPRSPLHGIPIVAKDVFDTFDMPTTAGFKPMATSQPSRDAFVIQRLRDAGAIILAKTNLSDWFGTYSLGGSTLGGQALNPYDLTRVPGYSSSGTGASLAAWFAAAGLGSDTGGSVVIPTADSALAGMTATQGLVSRKGMISSSFSSERGGPMARSVHDVAVLLDVMAGFDVADLTTAQSLGKMPAEPYASFLRSDGLQGARLGVFRDMFYSGPLHADGLKLIDAALADLKKGGALLVDPVSTGLDVPAAVADAALSSYERKFIQNHYLGLLPQDAPIRSLDEMLAKAPDIVKRGTAQANAIESLDHHAEYLARRENGFMLRDALVDLMERHRIDALVMPYKTRIAPKLGEDRPFQSINRLSSYTGLPTILVTAGFTPEGLPIALQFLGRPWSEPTLLRLAYAYEQATRHRRAPPTTPPLPGEVFEY